jgi:hypothetical protein
MYLPIYHSIKKLVVVILLSMHLLTSCTALHVEPNPNNTEETENQPTAITSTQTLEAPREAALAESKEMVCIEEIAQKTDKLAITILYESLYEPQSSLDRELPSHLIDPVSHIQEFKKEANTITKGKEKSSGEVYQKWIEKNTVDKEEVCEENQHTVLPWDQLGLPQEILESIVDHLDDRSRGSMRQLNGSFYSLLTGYSKPGIVGLENKPQGSFFKADWVQKKQN